MALHFRRKVKGLLFHVFMLSCISFFFHKLASRCLKESVKTRSLLFIYYEQINL